VLGPAKKIAVDSPARLEIRLVLYAIFIAGQRPKILHVIFVSILNQALL